MTEAIIVSDLPPWEQEEESQWQTKYRGNNYKGGTSMIVATTSGIEGRKISSYRGIVSGEVIIGINFLKDIMASLTNFFGGRSGAYENDLIKAREEALLEMQEHAAQLGANAVIGVDVKYVSIMMGNTSMLMVASSGTAVTLE
jgi:uncharacterized protein YbjQ (UPF0145 family)